MSALRENWRIIMLVVFLVVSGVALFAPGIGSSASAGDGNTTDGPTNLKYGLDLDGGARIRAPLVGIHATGVSVNQQQTNELQDAVADALGVDVIDVGTVLRSQSSADVEVYNDNVTQADLARALNETGYSYGEVRDGVTQETRDTVINTLQQKVNRGGLTGGTVTSVGQFVVVEVPGASLPDVRDLVSDRGTVQIVAERRYQNGTSINETVLVGDDINVNQIQQPDQQNPSWGVGITVNNDQAAREFSQAMIDLGFTQEGRGQCFRTGTAPPDGASWCLLAQLNGQIVHTNSMGSLADSINDGTFVDNPGLTIGAANQSVAQELRLNLQVGSLPTNLDIDAGTTSDILPSQAQEFKLFALITGLFAWFGVAGMVFLRYKDIRVALPMLFTAIAEVVILLGFSSFVGLALNLSHIAGFIAVIGTGVDDLVIIADEILQQGDVATGRVFQSRFRKAFWVIGAAAATTIIAMSPLAVLSLGDLQGFAIVTIAGVLIGVLVTRPAYGDVLRNLVLED